MFNLLTEREKEILRKEYSYRRALVYVTGLTGIGLLSLALLIPIGIISYSRQMSAKAEYASMITARGTAEQPDIADINNVNTLLGVLNTNREVTTLEMVDQILAMKPASVQVTSLGYLRQEQITIQLQGVAGSRDSLRAFARSLSTIKGFVVGELPISEFVKETDIPFTISIVFTPTL